MVKTLLLLLALGSFNAFAEDDMKDPLEGFKVDPADVQKSLDSMKASGNISAEDYQKASKELSGMSNMQLKALTETAVGMVRNNPDKAVELTKGKLDNAKVESQLRDLSRPKD